MRGIDEMLSTLIDSGIIVQEGVFLKVFRPE